MVKQTAGRDSLGDFAAEICRAERRRFVRRGMGERGQLSLKLRSILTVSALVSKGLIDSSFRYHLAAAKKNGVTKTEMAEILTQLAFYAGWPNAWAAFRTAKEVYQDEGGAEAVHGGMFGLARQTTPLHSIL